VFGLYLTLFLKILTTFSDQWSPANLEGKKQYDRQFLLQLQTVPLSLEKPLNLPQMDIIKDKSNQVIKLSQSVQSYPAPSHEPNNYVEGYSFETKIKGSDRYFFQCQ
jgi:hypothetical protein